MSNNKRLVAKIMEGDNVLMTIDKTLLNIEFGALDRGDITNVVEWGVYSNRGSLSFIDNKGLFKNAEQNEIPYILKIYISYKGKETLISTFNIESVSNLEETKEVKLQLIGKNSSLEKLSHNPFFDLIETSASNLSNIVYPAIKKGYDLKNIESTKIFCPHLEKGSVWNGLTKICQSSMSRVYENENGEPTISNSFPQRTPIEIKPQNILNISEPYFVRVANSSIDVLNVEKRFDSFVEGFSESIDINFNESGEPFSTSIGDYSFYKDDNYTNPTIKLDFELNTESQHNITKGIMGNGYVLLTESGERLFGNMIDGPGLSTMVESTFSSDIKKGDFYLDLSNKKIKLKINGLIVYRDLGENAAIIRTKKIVAKINTDYAIELGKQTIENISNESTNIVKIESNDLIQSDGYYLNDDGSKTSHAEHILQEVKRRYGKGIECFEIECLFNNYYYNNGNLAFSGEDLQNHFNKYDIIIPYVVKRGQTVPFRVNEKGEPKKFRIIGISYSYDGLLKQKLSVQEERYDLD